MDYFMNNKSATLYRMVMTDHMCPFGLKSKDLLQRQGYTVDDHHLTTREAVDEFKATHGVGTTPQTFINEVRICLLYTSPSPRDQRGSRMPSSA